MAILSLGIVVFVLWQILRSRQRRGKTLSLPPGPKGWPLIGNLFDMPSVHGWITYSDWAKRYGDVMSLKVMGQTMIILCSPQVVEDLFEKEAVKYSDRPHNIVLNEIIGYAEMMSSQPYGDLWKRQRRAFHQGLGPAMVGNYQPTIIRKSRSLLKQLMESPEHFNDHIRLTVGGLILEVVYGIPVSKRDDRWLLVSEMAGEAFLDAIRPGAFFVEQFPILRYVPAWFPLAGWKKKLSIYRQHMDTVFDEPFAYVRKQMARGDNTPSMLSTLLYESQQSDEPSLDEKAAKHATASVYLAGSDTTSTTIVLFILTMALHPVAQKKAQAELDKVVGPGRLPDFRDRPHLPYVNAVIKEVLRWKVLVPLGVPHAASSDGVYKGYFIPKGSIIVQNVWAALHDSNVYPNPEEFEPERFLKDGALHLANNDPTVAFGAGRRMCPGRWFAESVLYAVISQILSAFWMSPPLDEDGNEIPVSVEMFSLALSKPSPFECRIMPRSTSTKDIIVPDDI